MRWDIHTEENNFLLQHEETKKENKDENLWCKPKLTNYYFLGCCLSFLASVLRAAAFATTQILDDLANVFQLSFGKYSVMFVCNLLYIFISKKKSIFIWKSNVLTLGVFTLATLGLTLFSYLAVLYIAVGTAVSLASISFLCTMLVIHLVANFLDKAEMKWKWISIELISVSIMLCALVFVIQPYSTFLRVDYFKQRTNYSSFCHVQRFQNTTSTNDTDLGVLERTLTYQKHSWKGYLFASLAGLCNVVSVICNKELLKYEDMAAILFWGSAVNAGISFICALAMGGFVLPLGTVCGILLLLNALSSGIQNNVFVIGIKYISPTDAAAIASVTIGLLFFCQFTFLSSASPIPQNAVAVVAAMILFFVAAVKPLVQVFVAYKDIR